jgi:hypothetical protein
MIIKKTKRGFTYIEFKDRNNVECKIQKSSIATEDAIWLGAKEIGLKEFVAYRQPAWQDVDTTFSEKHHFVANNGMHLTRKQVKKLLPIFQKFVETGEID